MDLEDVESSMVTREALLVYADVAVSYARWLIGVKPVIEGSHMEPAYS